MLKMHLDDSTDLASRKSQTIDGTVAWIDRRIGLSGKHGCDLGCGSGLEQMAQKLAIAEAPMSVLRERGVIRQTVIQIETAKPAILEGSDALPRRACTLIGCRSSNRPAACGSVVLGLRTGAQCGRRNPPDAPECCSDRRSDQSSAEGDLVEHGLPTRTLRTVPPALPASVPSSSIPPSRGN